MRANMEKYWPVATSDKELMNPPPSAHFSKWANGIMRSGDSGLLAYMRSACHQPDRCKRHLQKVFAFYAVAGEERAEGLTTGIRSRAQLDRGDFRHFVDDVTKAHGGAASLAGYRSAMRPSPQQQQQQQQGGSDEASGWRGIFYDAARYATPDSTCARARGARASPSASASRTLSYGQFERAISLLYHEMLRLPTMPLCSSMKGESQSSWTDGYKTIIKNFVMPVTESHMRVAGAEDAISEQLSDPGVLGLVTTRMWPLHQLWRHYAKPIGMTKHATDGQRTMEAANGEGSSGAHAKGGGGEIMTFPQLCAFTSDFGLLGEGSPVNADSLHTVYTRVNAGDTADGNAGGLSFAEFLEAVCRAAVLFFPVRDLALQEALNTQSVVFKESGGGAEGTDRVHVYLRRNPWSLPNPASEQYDSLVHTVAMTQQQQQLQSQHGNGNSSSNSNSNSSSSSSSSSSRSKSKAGIRRRDRGKARRARARVVGRAQVGWCGTAN
jgi:hypothetical protein